MRSYVCVCAAVRVLCRQGLDDPTYLFGGEDELLFDEDYEQNDVVLFVIVHAWDCLS